ncbi:MAG: hypothetical protein ACMUIU_03550 [bacterium]
MATKNLIAQLYIRVRGYEQPDTRSQIEGSLDPGKYIVKEYRPNFPNKDTDYVLVLAPALGAGDTWICSRWKDHHYAQVIESAPMHTERMDFNNDGFAVPEEALVTLLPQFEDFTYDLDEARYPYQLPGVRLPQAPPKYNNCCTFVEALLVRAWANVHPGFQWSPARHAQMMIFSSDDYYSPVTAVVESEMGVSVANPDAQPHPWTVIQGWRRQWRDGHTFIIVDHHEPTDRVLTLESNSAYKLNGVGFRNIGNLRDINGRPPDNWWEQDDLWTWQRIIATYQYYRQAWLKVKNRNWSGLA